MYRWPALQLKQSKAEAGDIVLLYGDESEALTHPYLARVGEGADLRVPAPGQAKKVAMLGRSITSRANSSSIQPDQRSSDFIAHLEQLDRLFGPQPARQAKPVVLVEDNGPIHTSKLLAALAARHTGSPRGLRTDKIDRSGAEFKATITSRPDLQRRPPRPLLPP